MKKINYCATFFMFLSITVLSQKDVDSESKWNDRLYFGGGGGFNAGTQGGIKYFSISLSPVVGYMITSNFSAGTSIVYQHTSYSDFNFNYKQYGLMPFVRYNFKELFLTAEYNYINVPVLTYSGSGYSEASRIYRSRTLLGAGISQPIGGGNGRINAMALYDITYKIGNGFLSPWVFRVFFSF